MAYYYVLDDAGQPVACDADAWARWFETSCDERVVAKTEPTSGVEVSTVFLGLDHSFDDGPPIIFETMVFGGPLDEQGERYSTREQALSGHTRWVKNVIASTDV